MQKPLSAITLIVTRPKFQADVLIEAIEQAGGRVIHIPALEIKPLECSVILDADSFIIFTSHNAVIHSTHLWQKQPLTRIAIGPGTALALEKLGFPADYTPTDYSSEGLLQLPILREITQQKIYLCCGKNPRQFLFDELTRRGANVELIECYQRQPAQFEPEFFTELLKIRPQLIITTSQDTLRHFNNLLDKNAPPWLKKVPLLITHPSHLPLANQLGYSPVFISQSATTEDIIKTIIKHKSKLIELSAVT